MLLVDQNLPTKTNSNSVREDDPEYLLLQRIIDKDREAFQQLYLAYHERLYRFMYRMLQQHEDVSELVDDVMLIVWQKAESFRGQSKLSTWIMGIAHRTALKTYQKNKKYRQRHTNDRGLDYLPDHQSLNPETIASNKKIHDLIQTGLETISADKRSVVELTMQGYSYPEIAEIINCPVNTVKTRMFHARKELKEFLKDDFMAGEYHD